MQAWRQASKQASKQHILYTTTTIHMRIGIKKKNRMEMRAAR